MENHLIGRNTFFVLVEKDAVDFVFRYLQEETDWHVLLKPTEKEWDAYCTGDNIVMLNLVSEAPKCVDKYHSMCIEQMLVDIVAEKSFKNLYSKSELQGVYNLAEKSYLIDYARLLRYARRRGKADEIKNLPDRCSTDRLMRRISDLDFPEKEKLDIFEAFYLGTKDAAFGEFIRQNFTEESLNDYWKCEFENSRVGTVGFNERVSEYLLWGFEIDKLCEYVNFKDDEGNLLYEKFVTRIMDAKLHVKDKNCSDRLKIDQEEEHGI